MNAFQEKLMKAVSGNVLLAPIGEVKGEDMWYDADDADVPTVSQSSIKKVRNPLPVPVCCPHCGGNVKLMSNSVIYNGTEYGKWPYTYICWNTSCRAYVGCHPGTFIPLGTLATAPIREARKKAKAAFNPLWEDEHMSRSQAYAWLATQLGLKDKEECHIGWFDVAMCNKVVQVCNTRMGV